MSNPLGDSSDRGPIAAHSAEIGTMRIPTSWVCLGALGPLNKPQSKLDGASDARRLQLLIDAIVDYAIYMVDVDGIVCSWNAGAGRL
jgi:hypothetical protein